MSQLQTLFKGLCSDESMPETLTFIKNGVRTVLIKTEDIEGGARYVGTPSFKGRNGKMRLSEHALVLTSDCRVEGTYALNSIAVGGWNSGSKDPGYEVRNKLKEELVSTLITAAILVRQGENVTDTPLIKAVETEAGYPVIESPMTSEQRDLMAAAGVRNHIAELLDTKGWSLEIYPKDLAKKLGGYCEVQSGVWGSEAAAIATTAALDYKTVSTLKSLGYTLKKRVMRSRSNRYQNQ